MRHRLPIVVAVALLAAPPTAVALGSSPAETTPTTASEADGQPRGATTTQTEPAPATTATPPAADPATAPPAAGSATTAATPPPATNRPGAPQGPSTAIDPTRLEPDRDLAPRKPAAGSRGPRKRGSEADRHRGGGTEPKPTGDATTATPDPQATKDAAQAILDAPATGLSALSVAQFRIPPFLLPVYQAAGVQYGIRWEVLAAINEVETDYGRNLSVSTAGALGWMQFMPSTWLQYGVDATGDGTKDPYNPVDAIFAAARYLKAAGGETDIRKAIFAYNHADWYVADVLKRAQSIASLPSDVIASLTGLTLAQLPVYVAPDPSAKDGTAATDVRGRSGKASAGRGASASADDGTAKAPAATADGAAASGAAADDAATAGTTAEDATAEHDAKPASARDGVVVGPGPSKQWAEVRGPADAPVVAVQDGTVTRRGTSPSLGRYVELRDAYGNRYTYAHLGELATEHLVPRRSACSTDAGHAATKPGDATAKDEPATSSHGAPAAAKDDQDAPAAAKHDHGASAPAKDDHGAAAAAKHDDCSDEGDTATEHGTSHHATTRAAATTADAAAADAPISAPSASSPGVGPARPQVLGDPDGPTTSLRPLPTGADPSLTEPTTTGAVPPPVTTTAATPPPTTTAVPPTTTAVPPTTTATPPATLQAKPPTTDERPAGTGATPATGTTTTVAPSTATTTVPTPGTDPATGSAGTASAGPNDLLAAITAPIVAVAGKLHHAAFEARSGPAAKDGRTTGDRPVDELGRYLVRSGGLRRSDVRLRALRVGSKVLAGTILGRMDGASRAADQTGSAATGTSSIRFAIRPAGDGAPRIDPRPIIDGWRLLDDAAVFGNGERSALVADGASDERPDVGRLLLMSKEQLQQRVLANPSLSIYPSGIADIRAGAIDRRVLATMEYLTANGLKLSISSLKSGHSLLSSSGNVSAHSYGCAMDIAVVNGTPIIGHQGAGSITDTTIRKLLQLQGTMKPNQIISLMTYPGTDNTLSMPDHADHIHVGFPQAAGQGTVKLGRQVAAVLQPGQWDQLVSRLGRIANPTVRRSVSAAAVPAKPRTTSTSRGARGR